jgi:hypothetical protein
MNLFAGRDDFSGSGPGEGGADLITVCFLMSLRLAAMYYYP